MDELVKYLQSRKKTNGTAPKRFDECLYTPYSFTYPSAPPNDRGIDDSNKKLPEMFLFDYGVVVFWGMTLKQEQTILKLLVPFEDEKLGNNRLDIYYYY
jgi:uncharacterized Rmd1/YagE family protein